MGFMFPVRPSVYKKHFSTGKSGPARRVAEIHWIVTNNGPSSLAYAGQDGINSHRDGVMKACKEYGSICVGLLVLSRRSLECQR